MESILKLLTSLKTNEKSILITIIANALVLYLICFVGFENSKHINGINSL